MQYFSFVRDASRLEIVRVGFGFSCSCTYEEGLDAGVFRVEVWVGLIMGLGC